MNTGKPALGLLWLLPAAPPRPTRAPAPTPLPEAAAAIVAQSTQGHAHLALLGDKHLLLSPSGRALVMYGTIGRLWVAMGDPLGPPEEHPALIQSFCDQCRRHHARPAFYRVGPDHLPLYHRQGLTHLKLGDDARIRLDANGLLLDGNSRRDLRYARRRAARDGTSVQIVPPGPSSVLLRELRHVSNAWLRTKRTREKTFSVGRFDPAQLTQCHIALVRHHGTLVGFATIWLAADHAEVSVDLMRRTPDAPNITMDLLFVELMAWSAAQGYRWLNLGMTPLPSLAPRASPSILQTLLTFMIRRVSRFYDFEGLRAYKAKFAPDWRPSYLVCAGGLAMPKTVLAIARLVAGGLRGLIGR